MADRNGELGSLGLAARRNRRDERDVKRKTALAAVVLGVVALGPFAPPALALRTTAQSVASGSASAIGRGPAVASVNRAPLLHVAGNHLVNRRGARVVLHGVDRSGTEYACVQGWGFFDGPNNQASITAIKRWRINAVRVPLNEACWLGERYVKAAYRGQAYRRAIAAYVRLLNANGLDVILDLHWTDGVYTGPSSGCSSGHAICQKPMPDSGAMRFWSSVARWFKGDNAVVFDLFNEPYPELATGSEAQGWKCWRDGGSACPGIGYRVAGMRSLVRAVRSAGARNVLMLGGLGYANDLTKWIRYKPFDPVHNLTASWHSYNFNSCSTTSCWNSQIAPVLRRYPVIAGEIGEGDCAHGYIDGLMSWMDRRHASYLAWTWDDWPGACASGPALITNYGGAPTPYGVGYRRHLLALR